MHIGYWNSLYCVFFNNKYKYLQRSLQIDMAVTFSIRMFFSFFLGEFEVSKVVIIEFSSTSVLVWSDLLNASEYLKLFEQLLKDTIPQTLNFVSFFYNFKRSNTTSILWKFPVPCEVAFEVPNFSHFSLFF